MTASWMMYGTIVGLLVVAAGWATESFFRQLGRPVRWIWAAALAVTLLFVLAAPYRATANGNVAVASTTALVPLREPFVASSTWTGWARTAIADVQRAIASPLESIIGAVRRTVPASADAYLVLLWVAGSATLALLFAGVHVRFRRARRRWPSADVHGVRVRVAPSAGPAVVGLAPPEIVVPRWLLGRSREEQRLVVAHEVEHLRARDPWLLAFGCVAVALIPWNVAAWWMLGRIRLAVELDCDARVLAGNVTRRSYGELLIDLAEHCSGLRVDAPALAGDSSHLYKRLMAMQRPIARFALARAAAAGVLALAALLVACEATLPTDAQVASMDVASAERATTTMVRRAEAIKYVIDGVAATPEQAHALRSDQIATVEVTREPLSAGSEMRIRTTGSLDTIAVTARVGEKLVTLGRLGVKDSIRTNRLEREVGVERALVGYATKIELPPNSQRVPSKQGFSGIVFINGVRADDQALGALDRESILTVNVIKGLAATRLYSDPKAANGVIEVTTRAR